MIEECRRVRTLPVSNLSEVRTPRAAAGSSNGRSWTLTLLVQIVLVTGAALMYFAVRSLTEGEQSGAVLNAEELLRFESALGLAVTLANWVYIWAHWPVIIITLTWLFVRHRDSRPEGTLRRRSARSRRQPRPIPGTGA